MLHLLDSLRRAPLGVAGPWVLTIGLLAPAAAAPPDDASAYAAAADAARALEADARYYAARERLAAVEPAGLSPDLALERRSWIARLDNRRRAALEADLARAAKLGAAGDVEGARAVLGSVARYGSPDDEARAKAKLAEIEAAGQARAKSKAQQADEARQAAAAAKAKQKAALPVVSAAIRRWLKLRRQLTCSACRGAKETVCPACGGSGKRRVLGVAGGSGTVDCPRCEGGKVPCPACHALGLNRSRFDDVLLLPLGGEAQKQLGRRSQFMRQVERALRGEATEPPAIQALVQQMRWALEPALQTSRIEVTVEPAATSARARYMVQTPGGVREERVRFVPDGGRWVIVPGPIAGAPAPGAAHEAAKAPPAPSGR